MKLKLTVVFALFTGAAIAQACGNSDATDTMNPSTGGTTTTGGTTSSGGSISSGGTNSSAGAGNAIGNGNANSSGGENNNGSGGTNNNGSGGTNNNGSGDGFDSNAESCPGTTPTDGADCEAPQGGFPPNCLYGSGDACQCTFDFGGGGFGNGGFGNGGFDTTWQCAAIEENDDCPEAPDPGGNCMNPPGGFGAPTTGCEYADDYCVCRRQPGPDEWVCQNATGNGNGGNGGGGN